MHDPVKQEGQGKSKPKFYPPESRAKLREAALRNQPWKRSTGPRTAAGKARVALNGKKRQKGRLSVREARRLVADVGDLVQTMRSSRQQVLRALTSSV